MNTLNQWVRDYAQQQSGGDASKPRVIQYNNGCVFVHQSCTSENTSIYVYSKVGSIHEPKQNYGLSHFIEHLCFQRAHQSPEFEIMASMNATTHPDYTSYKFSHSNTLTAKSLTILGNMMFDMSFTQPMINNVERVIVQETGAGVTDSSFVDIFAGTSYDHQVDHSSYHIPLGQYTVDMVNDYYHQYYTPQNIVLSIVSNHTWDEINAMVRVSAFATHPRGINPPVTQIHTTLTPTNTPTFTFGGVLHPEISFRTCPYHHSDKPALELIQHYFQHAFVNTLYTDLRERYGQAYSIHTLIAFFRYTGYLSFRIIMDVNGARWKATKRTENNVFSIFVRAVQSVMSETTQVDWEGVKTGLLHETLVDLEQTAVLAAYNGRELVFGKKPEVVSYREYHAKYIAPLTSADILGIMRKYIVFSQAFLQLPVSMKANCGIIRNHFYI